MSIKILEPNVAAKIAAGEVVERPASVVKELVENALDAGAGQITVETKDSGLDYIRIVDNGTGIARNDIETAFNRYATSKISSIEDLDTIATLGFRGEALASIAAVSQIEIVTSIEEAETGDSLIVKDGKVVKHNQQARSHGTTITVRNLFKNVPARLKFLKSPATENGRTANVISQYALVYPEVRFSLSIDGRNVLQTPGNGKLQDAVIAVYGLNTAKQMLEISGGEVEWSGDSAVPITVTGMVGAPSVHRTKRDSLSLFVNRRAISSRLLTYAVEEAYHGLLMKDRHPVAIINIAIPPSEVDVNIHPTKAEVKFRNERTVFTAVQRAIRSTLVATSPVPKIEESNKPYIGTATPLVGQSSWSTSSRGEQTSMPLSSESGQTPTPRMTLPVLRVIGQIANNYIVSEGPDGLYVIDQHAAHERIRYEQIIAQKAKNEMQIQGMLEPATLEVTPQEDEILKSGASNLSDFGFTIEPFGERTYLVRAIPAILKDGNWQDMLHELLGSPHDKNIDFADKIIQLLACHSAIRSGQNLTDEEMRELIRQLEKAELPNTCPHGRPTILHLSIRQLEKEFGRT